MGEVLDINGKVIGVGRVCMLFSRHSSICIVSVFLNIPALFTEFLLRIILRILNLVTLCSYTVCC
jgi:hypothetical protein